MYTCTDNPPDPEYVPTAKSVAQSGFIDIQETMPDWPLPSSSKIIIINNNNDDFGL